MNKDDFDIFPHLKPSKPNTALDLVNGVEDRKYGYFKKNTKAKQNVELFAEEQLVRKQFLDEMRCEMPGLPRSTFLMVFSPDGQRVASTHGNHNIYVTEIKSGKHVRTLVGHPRTPWCIAFHPTSNQIVASGCLGGQVRIWDLSGGSEVWTSSSQSVIASIAFHPNDRILVIATVNEVYFWDWSRPEPFVHSSTCNPKEKVRFVAFDKLGHKLITGISNSPQTRWERVRAPVPVPRQERCASPYRRRITQRLVNNTGTPPPAHSSTPETPLHDRVPREPLSGVPERERRITVCYRNLVREYEQLVHRYLQLYRPPTMIDRGTDPMEQSSLSNSGTQTPDPSTSSGPSTSGLGSASQQERVAHITGSSSTGTPQNANTDPQPSTSQYKPTVSTSSTASYSDVEPSTSSGASQNLITPSRIFCVVKKPNTLIRGTQTSESRKHKAEVDTPGTSQEKRLKTDSGAGTRSAGSEENRAVEDSSAEAVSDVTEDRSGIDDRQSQEWSESGTQTQSPGRVLVVSLQRLGSDTVASNGSQDQRGRVAAEGGSQQATTSGMRIAYMRDYEDDLLWDSGAPQTERLIGLNEYIRANQQRLAAIHRRRRFRPTGEHPTTTSPIDSLPPREENDPLSRGLNLSSNSTGVDDFRTTNQSPDLNDAQLSESGSSNPGRQRNVDELLSNIRRTAEEEVRSRILPIIRSVPANDRPELIRLFENSREHVRMRFRQMCPTFLKKPNRRPITIDSSTDSSSSDNEDGASASRLTRRNSEPIAHTPPVTDVTTVSSSNAASSSNPNVSITNTTTTNSSNSPVVGSIRVRNFNTELEQLVTSLLTEIERNETERSESSVPMSDVQTTSLNTFSAASTTPSSARTRPSSCSRPSAPGEGADSFYFPPPLTRSSSSRDDLPLLNNLTPGSPVDNTAGPYPTPAPPIDSAASFINTSARTTDSMIYTSNGVPRRRFFSHRMSAFMPTRVNYTRTSSARIRRAHHPWGRGRSGPRLGSSSPSFAHDELINYSERESEDPDPPVPQWNFHPFDPPPEFPSINPENIGIGNMYSNIVQDLESSLNDVRNIRASSRPGETSDMLSSFSERLENIMNQSDTILRNLRSSMEMLPTASDVPTSWNFNDQGFYVRDLRNDNPSSVLNNSGEGSSSSDTINLQDLFAPFSAVAADHTYPRNPNDPNRTEHMTPLMTSLHLTISHIQRQARLLRRQVESIERIDRAMVEVAQLQLVRQLIIELIRHVRASSGESRSFGMSSVRQMMAGTRISDSSPYDSPGEEPTVDGNEPIPHRDQPINLSANRNESDPSVRPSTSSGNASGTSDQPGSSTGGPRRTSNRKTYPPSRLSRLSRHCQRRSSIVHWFSRRYLNRFERGANRQPLSSQSLFNYSIINSSTLSLMTRRLEHLLTDQMRIFTRPQESPQINRTTSSIDLGEHILALRLHGCLLRMNRVLGNTIESTALRNLHSDATAAVTHDGTNRYGARHTLSLIVDGMSRHIEELGSGHIQQSMRMQIHGVLAMSLLLTELLLLQVVDSIPPPTGMNLDPERENLTNRIDQMCTQMLHSRFSGNSHQLTRSLRLMRLTMRHAHRALGQTYNARRNAMMPRQDTDRRQLLGSINRCLRTIHRRRPNTNSTGGQGPLENEASAIPEPADVPRPSNSGNGNGNDNNAGGDAWYSTINDLITRFSDNHDDDVNNQPSTSTGRPDRGPSRNVMSSSNNDNSDADDPDEEQRWLSHRQAVRQELYRQNFPNLANPIAAIQQHNQNVSRSWNIPTVQINDGPVSANEPPLFAQRLMSQRQRFAERVSELRSNPSAGLFRPRFLHPLYASVNPFDADLDDPQREQIYDSDMITTVTPNHRLQAWDISNWTVPVISNSVKNVVVSECKIHNDASVDVAKDGTILVTLLPSGGYLNVTNRLGIYSLRWETLGQCLYTTSFEQNAVSVSLSPLSRHLAVGLASRRVSIVPTDRWVMARIFKIEQKDVPGDRLPILRELEQSRESRINCIRWLPISGQGFIYATNTGQLIILS